MKVFSSSSRCNASSLLSKESYRLHHHPSTSLRTPPRPEAQPTIQINHYQGMAATNVAAAVVEAMRGRTRDRIVRNAAKPNRSEETSTLRGRSRQRALSPRDADAAAAASRNPSPSLMSPARHLLIHNQLRERRRNHCPSRAASPSGRRPSVSRSHRRTQSPRGRGSRVRDAEPSRPAESLSSLRNEVFVEEERTPVDAEKSTPS